MKAFKILATAAVVAVSGFMFTSSASAQTDCGCSVRAEQVQQVRYRTMQVPVTVKTKSQEWQMETVNEPYDVTETKYRTEIRRVAYEVRRIDSCGCAGPTRVMYREEEVSVPFTTTHTEYREVQRPRLKWVEHTRTDMKTVRLPEEITEIAGQ